MEIKQLIKVGKASDFTEDEQGAVWYKHKICILDLKAIRDTILREAHDLSYSTHPGSTKMYQDLKDQYW